ncbi:MAG TPA: transposase, partial [Candidatus Competibacteraceae bacterium]|nr:transposase [Candidatus Competibacteraceae bacterium]
YGPVHLALARPPGEEEPWLIVSDQVTGPPTGNEDGLRFDREENLLEDQATGVLLEDAKRRSAAAIERLFFAIAAATLYLVVHGSAGVAPGRRREVDPDWVRGSRDLKLGWPWIKQALHKGWQWIPCWRLQGGEDPDPARASRRQDEASQQKFKQYK